MLRRDGQPVALTPKMFELLLVLVQNHGRIVDKDVLLRTVWPDSFVEEGNITFNIRQLRKALGDDAQAPQFIETIPRRGYRFVATVEDVSVEEPAAIQVSQVPAPSGIRRKLLPLAALAALLIGAIVIGAWFVTTKNVESAPVLAASFSSEKLTTNGTVFAAAISPDGKKVIYSVRTGAKQSVWLRELDTATSVQIIPPSDEDYYDLEFSPDGGLIYFVRAIRGVESHIDIYRVPVFGGIPEKIADQVWEQITISPDGSKIAFVRCPEQAEEWCSIWMADAKDGKNAQKLLSRPNLIRIGDIAISPDGKRIAFASGQSRTAANEFSLTEFDLETGTERPVTEEKFFNIKNIEWLPDQTGLIMTASRIPNKYFRIWHVSATTGSVESLTKDSESYSVLSFDKEAKYLIATQVKQDFRVNIFDLAKASEKHFISDGARADIGPDGKIYYAAISSGNDEIWSINRDGSGQRQLTSGSTDETKPLVSADGKAVYFVSNRSGSAQVWRMNSDGSDARQITQREGGAPVFATPDGKTLYYRHSLKGSLWSISLETGDESEVFSESKPFFAFAPDGSMFAFPGKQGDKIVLTISSASNPEAIKSIALPDETQLLLDAAWMPNGSDLLAALADKDNTTRAVYRIRSDGGTARKVVSLDDEELTEIQSLAVSRDAKYFAIVQGTWRHDAVLLKGLK